MQHASVELLDAAEAHLERVALRGELGVQRRPGRCALAAQLLNGGPEGLGVSTQLHRLEPALEVGEREAEHVLERVGTGRLLQRIGHHLAVGVESDHLAERAAFAVELLQFAAHCQHITVCLQPDVS